MDKTIIESIEKIANEQLDFIQAMGIDEEKENWKTTRNSLKDYIDILKENEKLELEKADKEAKRRMDERIEQHKIELEEKKLKNDLLKTGIIAAAFIGGTALAVYSDKTGEFISRTGHAIAMAIPKVLKF